jgi:hypothetical protein
MYTAVNEIIIQTMFINLEHVHGCEQADIIKHWPNIAWHLRETLWNKTPVTQTNKTAIAADRQQGNVKMSHILKQSCLLHSYQNRNT